MPPPQDSPVSPAQVFRASEALAEPTRQVCYRHQEVPAQAACTTCAQPLCADCVRMDFEGAACPSCAAAKRNRRKMRRAGVGLAAVLVAGTAAFLGSRLELPFDYKLHRPEVRRLESQLEADPCNRDIALKLAEEMLSAGNDLGVIKHIDGFFQGCGRWPRLAWVRFSAHKHLRQFPEALADVNWLIKDGPHDKDFRWWRGNLYLSMGDVDHAVQDFYQAIFLQPSVTSVPVELARLLEAQQRPCDALYPLQQLAHAYPELRRPMRLGLRLASLDGQCPDRYSLGSATLLERARDEYVTPAFVGGQPVQLVVDDVTPLVVLSSALAEKAGVTVSEPTRYILASRWGALHVRRGLVDVVKVQRAESHRVEVGVAENLPPGVEGILGLSFLSRYALQYVEDEEQMPMRLVLTELAGQEGPEDPE